MRERLGKGVGSILSLGCATALLYGVVYFAQRAIFLNGHLASNRSPELVALGGPVVPADAARLRWEAGTYYVATLALFVLYGWLLWSCRRGRVLSRGARRLALLFPVLFNLGLLIGRPYLSIDLWTYIAHSYLAVPLGENPYLAPARSVVATPFAARLVAVGWNPVHDVSPYGPLWTLFELAVGHVTLDVASAQLLIKSLVVAASLLSGWLIWLILGEVRPGDQLFGTLLYLWNPMVVVELAAEGHNDAVMIMLALLALLLAVRYRPVLALAALALSAYAKFVTLIILPLLAVFHWRTRTAWRQFVVQFGLALAASAALGVLLYRPLWAGPETFHGLREQAQVRFYASTPMLLFTYLERARPEEAASTLAGRLVGACFAGYLLIVALRIRERDDLLRTVGQAGVVYLLVAAPSYWPWYAVLPVALMALSPDRLFVAMVVVVSFCSRLVAPIDDMAVNGFGNWTREVWSITLIGLVVPLLCLLLLTICRGPGRLGSGRQTEPARCAAEAPTDPRGNAGRAG